MHGENEKNKTITLSIAAKVTGLSGLLSVVILLTIVIVVAVTVLTKNWDIYNTPEFIISIFSIILSISGVVCGASDLKRIRTGKSSKKGKVLDFTGIVSGAIGLTIRFITIPPIVLTQIIKI